MSDCYVLINFRVFLAWIRRVAPPTVGNRYMSLLKHVWKAFKRGHITALTNAPHGSKQTTVKEFVAAASSFIPCKEYALSNRNITNWLLYPVKQFFSIVRSTPPIFIQRSVIDTAIEEIKTERRNFIGCLDDADGGMAVLYNPHESKITTFVGRKYYAFPATIEWSLLTQNRGSATIALRADSETPIPMEPFVLEYCPIKDMLIPHPLVVGLHSFSQYLR